MIRAPVITGLIITLGLRKGASPLLQGWDGRTEAGAESAEPPAPARAPLDAVWQPVAGTSTRERFERHKYSKMASTPRARPAAAGAVLRPLRALCPRRGGGCEICHRIPQL
ncbi:hypothetical protein EVAR_32134_1 [Eumeta japonica]|uniref:Uncharacterized protein n=1 Tax=Eumeta variegata TaxID=151549 RepID=A0A4C1V612_EUMVA|nr:hypothetical protein EVAR_32134_1 [Eumeta japonica]